MKAYDTLIADCYRAAGLPWHGNVVYANTPAVALLTAIFGAGRHCISWTDPLIDPYEDHLDITAMDAIWDAGDAPHEAVGDDDVYDEFEDNVALDRRALSPIDGLSTSLQSEIVRVGGAFIDWQDIIGPTDPLLDELERMELQTRAVSIYRASLGDADYESLQKGLSQVGFVTPQAPVERMGVLRDDAYKLWAERFKGEQSSTHFSWWAFPWFAVVTVHDEA